MPLRKMMHHLSLRHLQVFINLLNINDTVLYESKYSNWTMDYIPSTKTIEITWMYRNTVQQVYNIPFNESE